MTIDPIGIAALGTLCYLAFLLGVRFVRFLRQGPTTGMFGASPPPRPDYETAFWLGALKPGDGVREVQDCTGIHRVHQGACFPSSPRPGDHYFTPGACYVWIGGAWVQEGAAIAPPTTPSNCVNCGATGTGPACLYCGTSHQ